MKIISVNASNEYDVIIGNNILPQVGQYISELKPCCKAAIISDTNVWPLFGNVVADSLEMSEVQSIHYVFEAGEGSKNISTYLNILNFLAENHITRSDLVIALGGGVVGDITGFVAATYLRGISYVQIPTSLLAMVDSSVGGKTAIDLPAGKNLVGAFKQPSLVLCDVNTLLTLPDTLFFDGCAEVIKYGMLYDAELFLYLQQTGLQFDRETVVAKCIAWKRDVVQQDEFDTASRQKLNLGHTIGHAIEVNSNFTITHGQAVAIGMAIITKASVKHGLCDVSVYDDLIHTLAQFKLPHSSDLSAAQLYTSALLDKKRSGNCVNMIVPRKIGQCDIMPVPLHEMESFIKAGL